MRHILTMAADGPDAADLMPLETPTLKVSRPVAACTRCRNSKTKCDGKLPVHEIVPIASHAQLTESPGVHFLRAEWQSGRVHQHQ